jgi:hypothetical protein
MPLVFGDGGLSLMVDIVLFALGASVLHWIIRTAVSGGMKDFDRWKRELDIQPDEQPGGAPADA